MKALKRSDTPTLLTGGWLTLGEALQNWGNRNRRWSV